MVTNIYIIKTMVNPMGSHCLVVINPIRHPWSTGVSPRPVWRFSIVTARSWPSSHAGRHRNMGGWAEFRKITVLTENPHIDIYIYIDICIYIYIYIYNLCISISISLYIYIYLYLSTYIYMG
jgi:hypothetical protein